MILPAVQVAHYMHLANQFCGGTKTKTVDIESELSNWNDFCDLSFGDATL